MQNQNTFFTGKAILNNKVFIYPICYLIQLISFDSFRVIVKAIVR